MALLGCVNLETPHVPDGAKPEVFGLTAITPDHGPEAGGTAVRVEGSGFAASTVVDLGGIPCAQLQFLSSQELLCTTPTGTGDVSLTVAEGGETASLPFHYDPPSVDSGTTTPPLNLSCTLENSRYTRSEGEGVQVPVLVTVAGRTEGAGAGAGIRGELGLRRTTADVSSTVWVPMTYSETVGDADRYLATTLADAGKWTLSARFSVDDGAMVDCGSASLEVTRTLDYCHIQYPCTATAAAGVDGPMAYVWVYQAGVTKGAGQGTGIQVELAFEDRGYAESFATDPSIWPWFYQLSYNADKDGINPGDLANDEYQGVLTGQSAAGDYRYAARATADEGLSWTYCDLGGSTCGGAGSDDGFSVFDAGIFTVY